MTGTTDRDYLKTNENLPAPKEGRVFAPNTRVQYLVTISAAMDGFPIKLFDTKESAIQFIKDNPPYPWNGRDLNSEEVNNAVDVYDSDSGTVYGYELFTIVNGVPDERRLYWWGEDDCTWTPAEGWKVGDNNTIQKVKS